MKLLHREDVLEAGYDLPTSGLCANIGAPEMEALRFGGEWILAEDETLVSDGHEQRFLYMVVSGEVAITKVSDQGKTQQIATLGTGAAFGEMAFLSGGVASANVQSIGETILWRFDHERLLGFIGEHGVAGGQLCLNVASILSGRLVDGNKKVVDMGRELQSSLAQLQQASSAGSGNGQALLQMQGKVANMQNAFKGSAVKKSSSLFTIAATVVAVLSTLGMVGLLVSMDDSSVREAITLSKKVKKLEANEEFYLGLKKKLEDENQILVDHGKTLEDEKEKLALGISRSMDDVQGLKDQLRTKERELSEAKDDIVRAQRVKVEPAAKITEPTEPVVSQSLVDQALAWSKTHTTLVFPLALQIKEKDITLQDAAQMVKIPVKVGRSVRAKGYHPQSSDFLVVAQEKSDKFLATIRVINSNFIDLVVLKYQEHANVDRGPVNPLLVAPKKKAVSPIRTVLPSTGPSPAKSKTSPLSLAPTIVKGKASNPQQPENMLEMGSSSKAKKVDTSDHGDNCVCKDCRVKKIGKGGSLFPDL